MSEEIVEKIFNDNNNPSCLNKPVILNDNVKISDYKGKKIIQVIILPEEFNAGPVTAKGNVYIRTGDGDRLATYEQLKFFTIENQRDVDIHLLPKSFSITDLSKDSINRYREQLGSKGIVNVSQDVSDQELLENLGVFRKNRLSNSNEYQLTDGGLLFFGAYVSITDRFPRFQVDYQKYDSDTGLNWIDRVSAGDMNSPSINLFSFCNLVLPKLTASVPDKYTQTDDYSRSSYYSDVTQAAKEALVNSLMHAYYDGEVGVKIIDRPSYFEFINPGTMRVSKESFLRGSYSSIRNTEIASLFRRIGVSETAASGGPRIYESAQKNHLIDPEIDVDYTMNITKIRIWKISSAQNSADNSNITDVERFIINLIKKNKIATVADIVTSPENIFGKESMIRNRLKELVHKGIIEQKKDGRKLNYVINRDAEYLKHMKQLKQLEDKYVRK